MNKKILLLLLTIIFLVSFGNSKVFANEFENDFFGNDLQSNKKIGATFSSPSDVWKDQTYNVAQDTHIQLSPSNSNHGDKEEIYLKGYTDTFKRDGLLMFELNPYTQPNQNGLTLRLPIKDLDKKGGNYLPEYYFSLYVTHTNWTENDASWDNMKNSDDYQKALLYDKIIITPSNIGKYIDIDVSNAMQYISKDGKIAFALMIEENPVDSNEGQNGGIKIYSKENMTNSVGVAQLVRGEVYAVNIDVNELVIVVGESPKLPTTVNVEFSDGTFSNIPVKWDTIDESLLLTDGEFYVWGTFAGMLERASVRVRVIPKGMIEGEITEDKGVEGNLETTHETSLHSEILETIVNQIQTSIVNNAPVVLQQVEMNFSDIKKEMSTIESTKIDVAKKSNKIIKNKAIMMQTTILAIFIGLLIFLFKRRKKGEE